ncbi:MAG: D-aminoacylase [Chloroflexi bacterium]|nr:D-aminoacylase [Chloroflexota bacterium]
MVTDRLTLLIRNGRIVDGSGNPWWHGDVAIAGDRIAALTRPGRIPRHAAPEELDATGMVVAPGFIDIQSHSNLTLMVDGRSLSKVTQGVTTEIMGETWTPAPLGGRHVEPLPWSAYESHLVEWRRQASNWVRFRDWLEALEQAGVSPNVGAFLPAGTLRQYALGMDALAPHADQQEMMRRVMAEAMDDGAFGVSYALIYPPDAYATTEEIIDVCRVVSRHGGIYITHMRSEADRLFEALEEALRIGREADVPVEIYHLKASGMRNWYRMPSVIARIDEARAQGQDVTACMYPYAASGTGLSALLPPWASEGGRLYERLREQSERQRIRESLEDPHSGAEMLASSRDPSGVMPLGFRLPEHRSYRGRRLSDIAAERGQDWVECVFDLLAAEQQAIATIYFSMDEHNLPLQLARPWVTIATDAGGLDPSWAAEYGPVHPRAYGTYPRVLGKYMREERVISLEEAIRKCSGAVAQRLGLRDRGMLRVGAYADIVVFDPASVADRATFTNPHQLAMGIRDVLVNGAVVVRDSQHTGATPGCFVFPS